MCFYLRDFTSDSHKDIIAFNDALQSFKEIQTAVLGMVFRVMQYLFHLVLTLPRSCLHRFSIFPPRVVNTATFARWSWA
jgi:hypothetical protein